MTPDGRARVEALPKGDPNDNETLRNFARAVLAVAAGRDRRADLDPGIRAHHRARLLRGRRLGADLDRDPAVDRAAALRRRAADAGAAAARRRGDARAVRAARHAAQLRQHHRAAAAARRRRRVQDLLHHGVARGSDRPAAIEPDARGVSTARSPPRRRSAACGSRAIPARRAWASCWRCRCSPRSRPRCCSSRC